MRHVIVRWAASAAGVAVIGQATSAGVMPSTPELSLELLLNDQSVFQATPDGEPGAGGQFVYEGMQTTDDWELDWDISADPDPFLMAGLSFTNNTGSTQTVTLITTLPISPAVAAPSLIGGSIQGGITADGDGGTLEATGEEAPIYRGLVDGSFVGDPAELFIGESVTVGAFESNSLAAAEEFGAPIPSATGPGASTSIGLRYDFTLTPGDQASFTGVFVLVPGPGGALALGGLGLLAIRRRR